MKISMRVINSFLLFLCFALEVKSGVINEHSLLKSFSDPLNTYMKKWDLTGSAEVTEDVIRLTSDEPGKQGAIWNNIACDTSNWELQLRFRIHGKGINLNGDGMAVWYTKERLHLGRVFGSKDYFSGLGVFIDTYENEGTEKNTYPRISAMVNNGSLHYNNNEDGIYTQISGCHAKVRNPEQFAKIAINYVRSVLTIYYDCDGSGTWKQCFVSRGIHLPTGYYFGISASTGELSDNHDVLAVTLLNMDASDMQKEDRTRIVPEAEYFKLPKEYKEEVIEEKISSSEKQEESQPTSILKMFLYGLLIVTVLSVTVIMFKKYNLRRIERMQKRLF